MTSPAVTYLSDFSTHIEVLVVNWESSVEKTPLTGPGWEHMMAPSRPSSWGGYCPCWVYVLHGLIRVWPYFSLSLYVMFYVWKKKNSRKGEQKNIVTEHF